MRSLFFFALSLLVSGCAYKTTGFSQLQMTARSSGDVYYGALTREYPPVVKITIDIDRRIYQGNYELTAPNTTFGFSRVYDRDEKASVMPAMLGNTNYGIAILSSTDRHILRCDFTSGENHPGRGICVEDTGRVYTVELS